MERRQFVLCGSVLASLPLLGCGDDEGGNGGSSSGGTASGSGGENGSTGGATNGSTGGSTNGSTGGSTSSGGNNMGGSGGGGGDDDACTGDLEGESTEDEGLDGLHLHAYTLSLSDIMSNGPVTLVLLAGQDAADHVHEVDLTAGDLEQLRNGGTVEKRSDGAHQHDVTLSCVDA